MTCAANSSAAKLQPLVREKFRDPRVTADGMPRASVSLRSLDTLWFNTGTLCNLACANCYIESSPRNDRLSYLTAAEACRYLDEVIELGLPTREIGITGGEPFMNPHIMEIIVAALDRGFHLLILTNAMRPMMKRAPDLLGVRDRAGDRLILRVSLDHYGPAVHEAERGPRTWEPAIKGLQWLCDHGFRVHVASRFLSGECEADMRAGFARLFAQLGVSIDASDPASLVLFPEMDAQADVPEITTACWDILDVKPDSLMCATSRMVVKRKGADGPVVLPCTLLTDDESFELGRTLSEAATTVSLNHPHCAKFCVLGGASCSAR